MTFDFRLLLLCSLVLLLESCSESNKVSGGTIEDQNALLEKQVNDWYNYGLDLNEAAYARIDGGRLAVLDDGSGARAECTADSASIAMTIQISGSVAVTTLKAEGLEQSCDSAFAEFKTNCDNKSNSEFFSLSEGCKEGAFDAACRVKAIESDSANILITYFSAIATNRCFEMSRNAQNSTGRGVTPSSSSKGGESSSSFSAGGREPLSTISPSDTAITIKYDQTLENYVLQYASSVEQLSFDEHVIAYNGLPSMNCIDFAELTLNVNTMELKSPLVKIEGNDIPQCFPMTAKIMKNRLKEKNESCQYFITFVDGGGLLTGSVLSHVADGELEFTKVKPSGECVSTDDYFSVFFLIEDCENEIMSTEPQVNHKTYESEFWKCEDGNYSPSPKANPYGEWFRGSLLL
jgi:hypothetical protein